MTRRRRRSGPMLSVPLRAVLGALPGTVVEVAERLGLPCDTALSPGVRAVEAALRAARAQGKVREVERPDHVYGWERTA